MKERRFTSSLQILVMWVTISILLLCGCKDLKFKGKPIALPYKDDIPIMPEAKYLEEYAYTSMELDSYTTYRETHYTFKILKPYAEVCQWYKEALPKVEWHEESIPYGNEYEYAEDVSDYGDDEESTQETSGAEKPKAKAPTPGEELVDTKISTYGAFKPAKPKAPLSEITIQISPSDIKRLTHTETDLVIMVQEPHDGF